jgi:hypothetical protein
MTKKNKELPKWFSGEKYNEGGVVKNPFSGEEYELDSLELSMYDFIIGVQWAFELSPLRVNEQMIDDFHKGLNWFRTKNPEAYMVLLD